MEGSPPHMNKNQIEEILDSQGIEYSYEDCKDNEISILTFYGDDSRIYDIDYLIKVLQGVIMFDNDDLIFWRTLT